MPTFGDTSQFSALMSNMLANARNRPMAAPGHKVLALSGSSPAISNKSASSNAKQMDIKSNIDLGAILSLMGKHPEQLKAQQEQDRKDAEMAWIHYNTDISPQDREKMYDDPRTQGLFDKWEKANPALFRNNPDTGRKELLPMSQEMMDKILGTKGLTKDQVLTLPDDHPLKQNYINGEKAIQPPTIAGLAGPQLIQDKYKADIEGEKARANEATAGAGYKREQAASEPARRGKMGAETYQATQTGDYLKAGKDATVKTNIATNKINAEDVTKTMGNYHDISKEYSKVDWRGLEPEDKTTKVVGLNSGTIGTLIDLRDKKAYGKIESVIGSWSTMLNPILSIPIDKSSGKLTVHQYNQLKNISDSIDKAIAAAGFNEKGQSNIPEYQGMDLINKQEEIQKLLKTGAPK